MPPHASGNDGDARPAVERLTVEGDRVLDLGRPTAGGVWGYWFCENCNNRTGTWDQEYLRWQVPLLQKLHFSNEPRNGPLVGEFTNADPGAFIRCLWAWMFALDRQLLHREPEVAKAVRTGGPCNPPTAVRLLIAISMSLRMWMAGQDGVAVAKLGNRGRVH